jgi:putative acetyltransferase
MTAVVRPETLADRPAVQELIRSAFASAGRTGGPLVEALLNDDLRKDPDWIPWLTLVAELDGVIVGQVTCSYGMLTDPLGAESPMVGVGPVSVLPARQRAGLGRRLLESVIQAADAAGEPALLLLGAPAFYRRFGFVAAAEVGIAAPDPLWGDHFQVRTLASYQAGADGRFRYAAPFQNL